MKACIDCGIPQPEDQFRGRRYCYTCEKKRKRNRYTYESTRDLNLRMNYGITLAEYNVLLESQGGVCAACGGKEMVRPGRSKRAADSTPMLNVDHCHRTGKIRGLLCSGCNQALGNLNDDISRIKALLAYLERVSV